MFELQDQSTDFTPFAARLAPALNEPLFEQADMFTWCPSLVFDGDRYHLFVSAWPKNLPFMASYPLCSQVYRAEARAPHGPYTLKGQVLPERGPEHWDGRVIHNPQVHRVGDKYVLFYIGSTFKGPRPGNAEQMNLEPARDLRESAYARFQIGYAVADHPEGPWERLDHAALAPRAGSWDSSITTNPAVCVSQDGSLLMIYRSNSPEGCRLGVARAGSLGEPFHRVVDEPILTGLDLEDPFIWQDAQTGLYNMIAKDLSGSITGEPHAGVHAISRAGVDWELAPQPKAYSRDLKYEDGEKRETGHLERPYVFRDQSGEPTLLLLATAVPQGPFGKIDKENKHTWITGVPLVG